MSIRRLQVALTLRDLPVEVVVADLEAEKVDRLGPGLARVLSFEDFGTIVSCVPDSRCPSRWSSDPGPDPVGATTACDETDERRESRTLAS